MFTDNFFVSSREDSIHKAHPHFVWLLRSDVVSLSRKDAAGTFGSAMPRSVDQRKSTQDTETGT